MAQENGTFAPLPESIKGFEDGVHKFVQGVFDEKVFDEIIEQANKPKITENELNENFAKKEFQTLWKYINHKYAYTVSFDSEELIQKAIKSIDEQMYVTELTYVRTIGSQNKDSFDFAEGKTKTTTLRGTGGSNVQYDLVGKIAQGTNLTRKTVVRILQGIRPDVLQCSRSTPKILSRAPLVLSPSKSNDDR